MTHKALTKFKELQDRCQEYITEISRLESRVARLQAENSQLEKSMVYGNGLLNQTKELYEALDAHILRTIDKRGYIKKPKGVRQPKRIDLTDLERYANEELLYKAKISDVGSFFRYHAPKSTMKLKYRLMSKLYRTSRDITKKGAKNSYNLFKKVRK